jgi:hypothetical protein
MCILVSLSLSVCPSFHMYELKICWMNYQEILYVGVLLNSVKTYIQFCLTFKIPGWHINFNACFMKSVITFWSEKDKIMK